MKNDRFEPDATTLLSDDQLLDALGRGERPVKDDPLLLAMALWREELDTAPAPVAVAAKPARKPGNKVRWGIISAAVAAMLGGGLTVAAASTAEPRSPLFPITKQVFPERASTASVNAAKLSLADARTAISEQELQVAEQKVKEAETLIGKVTSLLDQRALNAELAEVQDLLKTALGTTVPLPVPTPEPGLPIPTPTPGTDPLPLPTPTPSPSEGGGILPLPTLLPLPSLPLLG